LLWTDGYRAVFGDIADPRIWEPVAMQGRKIIVLTAPSHEISSQMTPITQRFFPELKRIAVVNDDKEAARLGLGTASEEARDRRWERGYGFGMTAANEQDGFRRPLS
jgi:hypothetical protein